MPEMPRPRQRHHNSLLICGINDFLIAHRSARLDYGSRTRRDHYIQPITEREKRIRSHR